MEGSEVIDVAQDALFTLLTISGPILGVALIVGLIVALFQTLTQIQEMTLTFVPKILVVFGSLLVLLPFIGSTMGAFFIRIMERISGV